MSAKEELLDKIKTAHRQLERYIFYYEKDEQGEFSASNRPKFSREEMLEPGIYGEWSLKDLLASLIKWEVYTVALLVTEKAEIPEPLPEPGSNWESILDADRVPNEIQDVELEDVVEGFSHSHVDLHTSVLATNEMMLFEEGVLEWTGEKAAADFIKLLTVELYDWTKSLVRGWRNRHAGKRLNKMLILESIRTERRRLEKNLAGISRQDLQVSGVVGKWSVKDLLAHLVEWERMFMGWYEAGLRGDTPEIPAPGYGWGEMDVLNERIYQKHCNRPLEEVLADFEASYRQVYELVESIPEKEIFTVGSYEWLGKGNLVTYILANTVNHYRWAKEKVRTWIKEKREI